MTNCRFADCQIHRLRWAERTTLVVVELHTTDGLIGLGEATMSGDDTAAACEIRRLFTTLLDGSDTTRIPVLIDALARHAQTATSLPIATAASAVEQALWDVRGQRLGLPVCALLGGARHDLIPLYANINRVPGDRTPAAFAAQAAAAIAAGFPAVKCAPFDEVLPADDSDEGLAAGVDRVRAVRDAVGADPAVMVDCHGRLGPRRALATVATLKRLRVKWLEEPVVTNAEMWRVVHRRSPDSPAAGPVDLSGLDQVAAAGVLPVAGGEFEVGLPAFFALLGRGALRYVMPDVKHCGGIWVSACVSSVAASLDVQLSPHNPSGPIATLASAHVAAAAASLDSLEIAWGELFPTDHQLLTPALDIAAGHLRLPPGPGLGARLVPETLLQLAIPFDEPSSTDRAST